jgi:hypothetical protein
MLAALLDPLIHLLQITNSRRQVAKTLLALGLAARLGIGSTEDGVAKKKSCGPCRIRTKGKCKGTKPNGTKCAGGQCLNGKCNSRCCRAGCTVLCASDEVCTGVEGLGCAPVCEGCADDPSLSCGCASTIKTEISFCHADFDLGTVCATAECTRQADCGAAGKICARLFCGGTLTGRCIAPCTD